jgi:Tol biopolymer transport system component
MKAHSCLAVAAPVILLLFAGGRLSAAITTRVSVSSTGEQADGLSQCPAISADGRFVAFFSDATNLVPDDTNNWYDVFVHDRLASATERASLSSTGNQGDGGSLTPGISADGRYVAFESGAANLSPDDTNSCSDVFVHDRLTGATERVSASSAGQQANKPSQQAAISADGRFVAFVSYATNLVPDDTNNWQDVFVHDRLTGATARVSVSGTGEQGDAPSYAPSISADGRYVAFISGATDLVPGDTNGTADIFVHDRLTGTTERVSVSSTGEQGDGSSGGLDDRPAISADGRFVAFSSYAANLAPDDTNSWTDVFVHDRLTGATERVSVSSTGEQGDAISYTSSISADGRYVAFDSVATNLAPDDTNSWSDVFVHDRLTGATERMSVSRTGQQDYGYSTYPAPTISADGRVVGFSSLTSSLVSGDTNDSRDVFVRVRWRFSDVPPEQWAFASVEACAEANVVKGYDDETYRPAVEITRDQMAVYIARALVSPSGDAAIADPEPPPSFSDVPPTHWAYKHIEYAVAQNVVQGYEDGTYGPGLTVDRGQMAAYVARAMLAPGGDAALPDPVPPVTFPDVPDTFWAYRHTEYCVENGVVAGYLDGLYHPEYVVTRDQMAVYIARAFGLL